MRRSGVMGISLGVVEGSREAIAPRRVMWNCLARLLAVNLASPALRLLLLMLTVALAGCAHTGRFARERHFHVESVDFREDGTFVFSCWFDDGGAELEVSGTWRPGEKKRTVVSTVPGLEDDERSACVHFGGREVWEYRLNGWHRGAEGPYRRVRQ